MRLLSKGRGRQRPTIVLSGLESVGKSALFRGLTLQATGTEANFRGSTVSCQSCFLPDCACDIVDTPGIRVEGDSAASLQALEVLEDADTVLLVARGTHVQRELSALLRLLGDRLAGKRAAVVLTFRDRAARGLRPVARALAAALAVPVVLVDARQFDDAARQRVLAAVGAAGALRADAELPHCAEVAPRRSIFDHSVAGPLAALSHILALFAFPVFVAYHIADRLEPLLEAAWIEPAQRLLAGLPGLPAAVLTGSYGLLTLGWYSFLWAFPVVLLIALTTALSEETGLHDRTTRALDPWLRRIGLAGRDLVPVLTGFGCNVVAVLQSRTCSRCTRSSCVSLIAYGSACSYQMAATLSLFGAAGQPWLFAPYLFVLFFVGALHTRVWHGPAADVRPVGDPAFLQRPKPAAVWWRVRAVLQQFVLQAMPIFLGICVAAATLDYFGAMSRLAAMAAPAMEFFGLPAEVAVGVVFSILRKDGLLTLHQDGGAVLDSLGAGQLFLTVYLASTLTACLVTLWAVRRELGWRTAADIAGKQACTALLTTWILGKAI